MTDIFQVLAYIVGKVGPLPRMKTHSLCYYAQAWHLVWEDKPLFKEEFEAWMSGPVCPELFEWHRWSYEKIGPEKLGSPDQLSEVQMETVDKVLEFYNSRPSYWLRDLLQQEHPWMVARHGLDPTERGSSIISQQSMWSYYTSLLSSGTSHLDEKKDVKTLYWVQMTLDGKVYRKGVREFDNHISSLGIKIIPQGVTPVLVESSQFLETHAVELAKEFIANNKDALHTWKIPPFLPE